MSFEQFLDVPDPNPDPLLLQLCAEMTILEELVRMGGLTFTGLSWVFHWLRHPNQIAAGNLFTVRERVEAAVCAALAAETGFPASYWSDRPLVDVPDVLGE